MRYCAILIISAFLAACGNDVSPKTPAPVDINNGNNQNNTSNMDGGTANNVTDPDMGPDTVPDATMSSQDAPNIIELGVSPTTLSEGGSTLVSAIVTDPQGVEDIVAGRLLDGQTEALIGNFRSIGGGSFELDVSWSQLDGVRSIVFGPGGTQRTLTAEFIDNANERSTRSISITLSCEGVSACDGRCGLELCGGECLDPFDDYSTTNNCGMCGNSCGADEVCSDSTCVSGSGLNGPCTFQEDCTIEDSFCVSEGETGVPGGVCAVLCQDSFECPANAECVFLSTPQTGEITLCAETCTSSDQCRSDWSCLGVETAEGGFVDVCSPDSF